MNKAYKVGARSGMEVDGMKHQQAMKGDWRDYIVKVENYKFGYKFADLQAKGYIKEIDDTDMIERIIADVPPAVFDELMKVVTGEIRAGEDDFGIGDIDPKK
jgi:hypothetical protein